MRVRLLCVWRVIDETAATDRDERAQLLPTVCRLTTGRPDDPDHEDGKTGGRYRDAT